jgi:hypothetical protein
VVSAISREEVLDFFGRYRAAFDTLDGDAVADLWQVPCAISSVRADDPHANVVWWHDDAPMRDNMRALCEVYRSGGYALAAFELRHFTPMGPHHAFADVAWVLHRADGSLLQAFRTGYQLMRGPNGLRVLMCIAHDEELSAMQSASR